MDVNQYRSTAIILFSCEIIGKPRQERVLRLDVADMQEIYQSEGRLADVAAGRMERAFAFDGRYLEQYHDV